jgi:putative ABC transport system substrate-binding protein
MKHREFLILTAGTTVTWLLDARAQQNPKPVIGVLFGGSRALVTPNFPALLAGLAEVGYVDGQNVNIEYSTAEGQYELLPGLAADLVSRKVDVIITLASAASLAAKAATSTIPVVFVIGADPVGLGLVASLNRPGGNLTGATFLGLELTAKQLELVHEITPTATTIGFLINPAGPDQAIQTSRAQAAARALGLTLGVVDAPVGSNFTAAFAALAEQRVGALLVAGDEFLTSQAARIVELAARHAIPAVYALRAFTVAGGLASYGASLADTLRQSGVYVGRILKGAKPVELPAVQTSKFELVINLKTAKALNLTVPQSIFARADEVIE